MIYVVNIPSKDTISSLLLFSPIVILCYCYFPPLLFSAIVILYYRFHWPNLVELFYVLIGWLFESWN